MGAHLDAGCAAPTTTGKRLRTRGQPAHVLGPQGHRAHARCQTMPSVCTLEIRQVAKDKRRPPLPHGFGKAKGFQCCVEYVARSRHGSSTDASWQWPSSPPTTGVGPRIVRQARVVVFGGRRPGGIVLQRVNSIARQAVMQFMVAALLWQFDDDASGAASRGALPVPPPHAHPWAGFRQNLGQAGNASDFASTACVIICKTVCGWQEPQRAICLQPVARRSGLPRSDVACLWSSTHSVAADDALPTFTKRRPMTRCFADPQARYCFVA